MSTNRSRRIDHDTAEQLLDGAGVGAATGHDALAGLLAAAAAPAAERELSGEQAALTAFRAARLAPVPPSRKRSMLTSALAQLLSAKVAAAVLVTAVGGVGVAAASGNLPAALGGSPGHGGRLPAATASAGAPGTLPQGAVTGSRGAVAPALVALCRAYAKDGGQKPGSVLAEHRFAELVAAAGGQAGVAGYCAPLLTGPGSGGSASLDAQSTAVRPSTVPTHPDTPGASRRADDPGASHAADPSGHPTGHPTSHPTGHPHADPSPPPKSTPSAHPTG